MSRRGPRLPRHVGAALGACGVSAAALYPLCGLSFRCGCLALGLGGYAHCNVHRSGGPHCPWCEHAALGALGLVLTLALQALVYWPVWKRSRSEAAAGFAALVAFPAAALLGAFLTWLPTDYPHFLAFGARASLGLAEGPLRCGGP